ncbi:MAG TPA: class I SAM-dependent methyltransferase [Acidimicrobiales bacterium]|nr:class I SAM-dependent methyltransferase [Acidimicrobiales bacterium]
MAVPPPTAPVESAGPGEAPYRQAAHEVVEFFAGDGLVMKGKRVADVGCGDGMTDLVLAAEAGPDLVVGFDLTPVDPRELEKQALEDGVVTRYPGNLEFRQCGPERLTAEDASFDYVFSWSAFEHIANPLPVLREIRRVLRPGGTLMIQVWPFFYSKHGSHLWDWYPEGFAPLLHDTDTVIGRVRDNPDLGPPWSELLIKAYRELNRITVDELHRDLMVAGFRIAKLQLLTETFHIPPELASLPPSLVGISGVKLLACIR